MIGSDRFGFLVVIGRYTDHHRSAKYRPITDTDQKIGRALIDIYDSDDEDYDYYSTQLF